MSLKNFLHPYVAESLQINFTNQALAKNKNKNKKRLLSRSLVPKLQIR
jgi:hypothetical protein